MAVTTATTKKVIFYIKGKIVNTQGLELFFYDDDSDTPNCAGSCDPGSRCRLCKMYIYFWETPGGRDFGMRGIWVDWGNGEISLRATCD
jgi:hypothetical protein